MSSSLQQLKYYASLMVNAVDVYHGPGPIGAVWNELLEAGALLNLIEREELAPREYHLSKQGDQGPRVIFRGEPQGHEVSSLILTLLQHSGVYPKITESQSKRIASIRSLLDVETFYSAECTKCPNVVQALNIIALLNENVRHTSVNGFYYQEEAEARGVLSVPSVFIGGELVFNGDTTIDSILDSLGAEDAEVAEEVLCDVAVVGGGPSGATAALYAARKGLSVALLTDRVGGQLLDTASIENITGVDYTTGSAMSSEMQSQILKYGVSVVLGETKELENNERGFTMLCGGSRVQAKTVVVATGAKWRELGVPGEQRLKNRGVTFCPHCDGPLFTGKNVVVVGGGNSGVEAALDLSVTSSSVTLIELSKSLPADAVLVKSLTSKPNVRVMNGTRVLEINGESNVEEIVIESVDSGDTEVIKTDGVFIQAGLTPNTAWLGDFLSKNSRGEIIVDKKGSTSVPGVFAGGDATDSVYKQIATAVSGGAVAAISAAEYLNTNLRALS
jgi:alkyl hydroperoxide reductase subunit F